MTNILYTIAVHIFPYTQVQNARASLQSAVVCAVCSSPDVWSRRNRQETTAPSAFGTGSSLKSAWRVQALTLFLALMKFSGNPYFLCYVVGGAITHLLE